MAAKISHLLLAFPVLFIAVFVADRLFRRHLRSQHPETWTSLRGSTRPWLRPMAKSLNFVRFLWTSKYKDLNDPSLNELAFWVKALSLVYSAVLFLLLVTAMTQIHLNLLP